MEVFFFDAKPQSREGAKKRKDFHERDLLGYEKQNKTLKDVLEHCWVFVFFRLSLRSFCLCGPLHLRDFASRKTHFVSIDEIIRDSVVKIFSPLKAYDRYQRGQSHLRINGET